jgi:hypothetical protein
MEDIVWENGGGGGGREKTGDGSTEWDYNGKIGSFES